MSVTVKIFAALREQIGQDKFELDVEGSENVRDVWSRMTEINLDPHILVAINQEYANQESPITDGDEVAFFPPVTGG